ncbi:MAG: hypothetical protein U0V70_10345 [Terriglobia bacterium]
MALDEKNVTGSWLLHWRFHQVEIVDLNSFQVVHSILGLKEPQGIAFVQDIDRFFVADGGDGRVNAYDGESYKAPRFH